MSAAATPQLQDILKKTTEHFKQKGIESARTDAEILLAHALKLKRIELYLKFEYPLNEAELKTCRELVMRRSRGEPVAYITGSRGFYKSDFIVRPGVLIPRPETELLVETATEWARQHGGVDQSWVVADFGCGSGCIGLSLLQDLPNARLWAVELSGEAAAVARENAKALQLDSRTTFVESSVETISDSKVLFGGPEDLGFDIVVANPPYIGKDEEVGPGVKEFEPHAALYAEDNGLAAVKSWAKVAGNILKPGGLCTFEIGSKQGDKVRQFFEELGTFQNVKILKDYAGLDRVVVCNKG